MAIVATQIPLLQTQPFLRFSVSLDGTEYVVVLEWNQRAGWYMGVQDTAGDWIACPRRLAVGSNILEYCSDPRKPYGVLVLIDMDQTGEECGYDELGSGKRCELFYITNDGT